MMIPPLPGAAPSYVDGQRDCVVLLHGLWRGMTAMAPIQRALQKAGYATLNIPYPSFIKRLEEISEPVVSAVKDLVPEGKKLHFVTHSLGGIVARYVLTTGLLERSEKLVMLAPPSTGSDIIEWAGECLPVRLLLGPAGCSLTVNNCVDNVPFAHAAPDGVRGCAIMGDAPLIPGMQWLLPGPNDGIVTVEGGRLPWLEEFHVVPGDHTYIMQRADVQRLTLDFLAKD